MALTATVSKAAVHKVHDGMWYVFFRLVLDNGGTVLDREFSETFKTGYDKDALGEKVLPEIQAVIDEYKAEQALFGHAKFDAAVVRVQEGLVV